jgi:phospholipase C
MKFADFLRDCAAGTLPQVSLVSPGTHAYTEESPNDIQLGEAYSAAIVNAVMSGPGWDKTAMFFTYDEHGGYYDHVPPPAAVPPDNIAPMTQPGDQPGGFDVYGPRVPGFVISPFAKKDYVSHVVHDHTSILKFIETKFNLGAMTARDANADDLLDCFDFKAAAFREPPTLPGPALPSTGSTCEPAPAVATPSSIQPSPA